MTETSNDPAAHLIKLDALEQGFEIAFAEAFVALALDDLEEDRANHVLGEDLQQQPLPLGRAPSIKIPRCFNSGIDSPWPSMRLSSSS